MTGNVLLRWRDHRCFPYEREFARREVAALFGLKPIEVANGLLVRTERRHVGAFARLTYFGEAVSAEGRIIIPAQAQIESAARGSVAGNGHSARRQSTRYSAHGIHEYRGKFNPQVVRAIGNMLGLQERAWVLDPFCGSGTTLLESAHVGWNAAGVDQNPLGVLISNAKIAAFKCEPGRLRAEQKALGARVEGRALCISRSDDISETTLRRVGGAHWLRRIPSPEYLSHWFSRPVLCQLAVILEEIERCPSADLQAVFKVILSDVVRDSSLQEPVDLRIRRRKNPAPNYPLVTTFLESLNAKIIAVLNTRRILTPAVAHQEAVAGDSRMPLNTIRDGMSRHGLELFDAIITSPPYVTALPYIDTQRLSLCALGLVSASALRRQEQGQVGNREITQGERREGNRAVAENRWGLPGPVARLCSRMLDASLSPGNGFRRQNTPALVYRYFTDMAKVFRSVLPLMRPKAVAALVVGKNRATLGSEQFEIDTPTFLAEVASDAGFSVRELVPLDTFQRFDVHHKNSITAESLLVLERPEGRGSSTAKRATRPR